MVDLLSHLSSEEQLALRSEDQLAYTKKARILAGTQVASSEIRRLAMIALRDRARNHQAVTERADAQGSDVISTPIGRLRWAVEEIHSQLDFQKGDGINAQQRELRGVLHAIWDEMQQQIEELAKRNEHEQVAVMVEQRGAEKEEQRDAPAPKRPPPPSPHNEMEKKIDAAIEQQQHQPQLPLPQQQPEISCHTTLELRK